MLPDKKCATVILYTKRIFSRYQIMGQSLPPNTMKNLLGVGISDITLPKSQSAMGK